MPQKHRPLNREEVERDAALIVIASEDTYAVDQYFEHFRMRRVQIEVLPTKDGRSSPKELIQRLDDFKKSYPIEDEDQFWICFDMDHWREPNHIQHLVEALKHCGQKGHFVAISNPCFELWILLHFRDPDIAMCGSCDDVARQLKASTGGYNKTKCCGSMTLTIEQVRQAIARATALENGQGDIPDKPVTRMHAILEAILSKGLIVMS